MLREGDILLVEAGPEEMKLLEDKAGLEMGPEPGDEPASEEEREEGEAFDPEGLHLVEAVVRNDSMMINRTVAQLRLHNQYGLHLVAVARDGGRLNQRLRDIRFRAGDVLLLQGGENELTDSLTTLAACRWPSAI